MRGLGGCRAQDGGQGVLGFGVCELGFPQDVTRSLLGGGGLLVTSVLCSEEYLLWVSGLKPVSLTPAGSPCALSPLMPQPPTGLGRAEPGVGASRLPVTVNPTIR